MTALPAPKVLKPPNRSKAFQRLKLIVALVAVATATSGVFLLVSDMGDQRVPMSVCLAAFAGLVVLEAAIQACGGHRIVRANKARKERDEEAWLNDMVNAGFTTEQALLLRKRPD